MATKSENQITMLTKISIVVNILLFGITGIIFLYKTKYVLGLVLLAAGFFNIISMLFTFNRKNIVFLALNILFTIVSVIVFFDYLLKNINYIALLWLAVSGYYLITVGVLWYRIFKEKKE
jgi:hypothetical protein